MEFGRDAVEEFRDECCIHLLYLQESYNASQCILESILASPGSACAVLTERFTIDCLADFAITKHFGLATTLCYCSRDVACLQYLVNISHGACNLEGKPKNHTTRMERVKRVKKLSPFRDRAGT